MLIAYDRDPTNDKTTDTLAETLLTKNIKYFHIVFPQSANANAFTYNASSTTEALGQIIQATK